MVLTLFSFSPSSFFAGQSTSFTTIQSEVKSTHLDYHQLAPPNFVTDSYQGLTWRLGFGLFDPAPAEWAPHQAEFNWPFSVDTYVPKLSVERI